MLLNFVTTFLSLLVASFVFYLMLVIALVLDETLRHDPHDRVARAKYLHLWSRLNWAFAGLVFGSFFISAYFAYTGG